MQFISLIIVLLSLWGVEHLLTDANLPELALQHPLKKEIIRQASFKDGQGRVIAWLLGSSGFEQSGKSKPSVCLFEMFCYFV